MRQFYISLIVVITALSSCAKDNHNEPADEGPGTYFPPSSVIDKATVNHNTVMLGSLSNNYVSAFKKRFTKISATINNETYVLITPSQLLDNVKDGVLDVYNRGGIVIVVNPNIEVLNEWLNQQNINLTFSSENKQALVAFCNNDLYLLQDFDNSEDVAEKLNALVEWTNQTFHPDIFDPVYPNSDIRKLIDAQSITFTYPFTIRHKEAHVVASNPDSLVRSGMITLKYEIFPLYAFQDQNGNGDYYIVTASIKANNNTMYAGRYTSKHGWVSVRLCGFYMKELNMKSTLKASSGQAAITFPLSYTPTPKTTQGATSYSNGFSWNLGADVSVGADLKGPRGSVTVKGGVSFSNNESKQIQDIDIANNSSSEDAVFKYIANNLPKMSGLSITDPPEIAVSGAEFVQSWVWRVPSTKDYTTTKFTLSSTASVTYGSCHFISTAADYYQTDHQVTTSSFFAELTAPSRIPTGKLVIANTNHEEYITDINITKKGETKPYYTSTGSIAEGSEFRLDIPVGKCTITFRMGKNVASTKTYTLSEGPISIVRGETVSLNSAFDFKEE
jgi:hypothetical protein